MLHCSDVSKLNADQFINCNVITMKIRFCAFLFFFSFFFYKIIQYYDNTHIFLQEKKENV